MLKDVDAPLYTHCSEHAVPQACNGCRYEFQAQLVYLHDGVLCREYRDIAHARSLVENYNEKFSAMDERAGHLFESAALQVLGEEKQALVRHTVSRLYSLWDTRWLVDDYEKTQEAMFHEIVGHTDLGLSHTLTGYLGTSRRQLEAMAWPLLVKQRQLLDTEFSVSSAEHDAICQSIPFLC